jgi:VWFA-related protein
MSRRSTTGWPGAAALLLALLASAAVSAQQQETQEGAAETAAAPRESDLVERATRRLAQIDVTVSGREEDIADLTPADFELVVNHQRIEDFTVDRICNRLEGGELRTVERIETVAEEVPETLEPAAPRPTFLFYFDHAHLTMAGWNRAVQMAREFIPELVQDGARGVLVSSGRAVVTYADLTDDPEALLAGLQRMEDDREWDPFSQQEGSRIQEILDDIQKISVQAGLATARRHQREERWRTGKALRRFSMVLGRLSELDAPKAALYFADTMRQNAGEHYVSLFNRAQAKVDDPDLTVMRTDAFTARNPFDKVVDEAAAHGTRVYTIHAQGLTATIGPMKRPTDGQGMSPDAIRRPVADAVDSMKSMAVETGGKAFTGGYRNRSVVTTIREDLSCLYLVSFDPTGFPEDVALPVRLRSEKKGVRVHSRGRVLFQSEDARLTSKLLAAFGAPSAIEDSAPIRSSVVPIGFSDGGFDALLQVFVPGAPVSGAVWDLGASVVSQDRVLDDTSGRIEVPGPGIPVVLETRTRFQPGPYSVVSVAHEMTSDQTASREMKGDWPNPKAQPVVVVPVTIVQPAEGVFVREGAVRKSGPLAVARDGFVQTDLPTAFIGLVCWDRVQKATLTVERKLVGASAADFPPMTIEPDKERCAYFRDLVEGKTMTPGVFTYEVRVLAKESEVARLDHEFAADDGTLAAEPAVAPAAVGGTP